MRARSVCRGRALPLPARPSLPPSRCILCFLTAHAALSLCVSDFLLVAVVRVPMFLGRPVLSLFTGRRRQLLDLHEGTMFPAEDPANALGRVASHCARVEEPYGCRPCVEDTAATARHCVPVCRRPSCVLLFCYMETPTVCRKDYPTCTAQQKKVEALCHRAQRRRLVAAMVSTKPGKNDCLGEPEGEQRERQCYGVQESNGGVGRTTASRLPQ